MINGYGLEAVHAARLLVETSVVADATRHLGTDDTRRLEDSISAQERAFNDPVRFLICDREFHLTIHYASTNRLLADFVVDLYTYMLDHRRIAMAQPGAIEKSLEDAMARSCPVRASIRRCSRSRSWRKPQSSPY